MKRNNCNYIIKELNSGIIKWYHIPPELRVILSKTIADWIEINPNQELPSHKSLRTNIVDADYDFNNINIDPPS